MQVKLENLPLKIVAEQMAEAVVLADKKGRITWANPAFEDLCGYARQEVLGKVPGDLLQGEDTDPETVRALRFALEESLEIRTDILNYHKDGHSYWARVSITPLRDTEGQSQGFIAIERDVTEEHKRHKELHGEVVTLYATILGQEHSQGLEMDAYDPFYESAREVSLSYPDGRT